MPCTTVTVASAVAAAAGIAVAAPAARHRTPAAVRPPRNDRVTRMRMAVNVSR